MIQVVLQQDRGRRGIEPRLAPTPVAFADRQSRVGFVAGQSLILRDDRDRDSRTQRADDIGGDSGRVGRLAVETSRNTNDNDAQAVFLCRALVDCLDDRVYCSTGRSTGRSTCGPTR